MPTLIPTIGAPDANSYETLAEANTYFDERIPLPTPWVASGDASIRALLTATRTLDMMAVRHKTLQLATNGQKYLIVTRAWTGAPASSTQRLSWPRVGMFDRNGNALNADIASISVAAATNINTGTQKHNIRDGETVFITGSDSTPSVDGARVATVIDAYNFTIPVTVTVAGTTGVVCRMPQELKDAESELAGQLLMQDTLLNNDVITGGITSVKAGSVAISFKGDILNAVLPDAVLNLMPASWFTDQEIIPAEFAQFNVL